MLAGITSWLFAQPLIQDSNKFLKYCVGFKPVLGLVVSNRVVLSQAQNYGHR